MEDVLAANLVTISRVKSCFTGQRGSLYRFLPKWVALGGGMVLLAIGEGMLAPVTVAALRRYTTTAQRSIAFSVFYAAMNAGFYMAVHVSDALRAGLGS
jgi:hypothetical protein